MKTMKAIATQQTDATAGLFDPRQVSMTAFGGTKVLLLLLLAFVSALALTTAQTATAQTINSYIENEWPNNRYTNHSNGTVTDRKTGLMWKQCPEGQSKGFCADDGDTKGFNWKEALEHGNNHTFAGKSDWRVPNIKELTSLAALNRYEPAINSTLFPNTPSEGFWSASPDPEADPGDYNYAWYVLFYDGSGRSSDSSTRDSTLRLRLVRGGQ